MNDSQRLRCILIVGLGSIGRRHCKILRNLYPSVILIALRHRDCDAETGKSLEVDHCVSSVEEAITCKPDMAILANPAPFHISIALPLAEAGVHLLVEKPLSVSRQGIRQLIDCCHRNKCVLMTGYNLRFLPSLRFFYDCIKRGVIGKCLSVRVETGQSLRLWRPGTDYRTSVSAQKKLGGGVLLELSHEIDYLLWIFGGVDWVSANLTQQSNLEIDVEDTANLLLGFCAKNDGSQLVSSVSIDFVRYDSTRCCTAIGESGSLCWDGVAGSVEMYSATDGTWKELFCDKPERNFTYEEELRHFVDCVYEGSMPIVSGEDGLAVVKVIEAARESSNNDGKKTWLN